MLRFRPVPPALRDLPGWDVCLSTPVRWSRHGEMMRAAWSDRRHPLRVLMAPYRFLAPELRPLVLELHLAGFSPRDLALLRMAPRVILSRRTIRTLRWWLPGLMGLLVAMTLGSVTMAGGNSPWVPGLAAGLGIFLHLHVWLLPSRFAFAHAIVYSTFHAFGGKSSVRDRRLTVAFLFLLGLPLFVLALTGPLGAALELRDDYDWLLIAGLLQLLAGSCAWVWRGRLENLCRDAALSDLRRQLHGIRTLFEEYLTATEAVVDQP